MVEINPNEKVRLIKRTTGNRVSVVTGRASSSGKSVIVESQGSKRRLDTVRLESGDLVSRGNCFFEIYDPEEFHRQQKMNKSPPQIAGGVNPSEIKSVSELPAATHELQRNY